MFSKVWRKLTTSKQVEFCDTCAQVCTGECRAEAHFGKVREQAAYHFPFIR
jgi:hypothetical protein